MTTEKRRAPAGAAVLRGEITSAIRAAVMQELAEVGYGRLSIEAVARRASSARVSPDSGSATAVLAMFRRSDLSC